MNELNGSFSFRCHFFFASSSTSTSSTSCLAYFIFMIVNKWFMPTTMWSSVSQPVSQSIVSGWLKEQTGAMTNKLRLILVHFIHFSTYVQVCEFVCMLYVNERIGIIAATNQKDFGIAVINWLLNMESIQFNFVCLVCAPHAPHHLLNWIWLKKCQQ